MCRQPVLGSMPGKILVSLLASALCHAQTPNASLQAAVDRAMAGKRGTAVVLDVATGRVLAAYQLDVAAQRLAYPGSSIKPFTLFALLESGKLDAETKLVCNRQLSIAGRRLNCSHPQTPQPLDPAAALAYSCNSYFTKVASRLTPAQLRDSFVNYGFTARTGLARKEVAGSVALASTPDELQLEAIGEWGLRLTPLELLSGYRKLALMAIHKGDAKLAPLFEGLRGSTSYGMGRLAQPDVGISVAGKTGTAPSDEGPWTHAWFAGFAPANNPEIVLVVFLEVGRGGSDATQVASQTFAAYAKHVKASLAAGAQH
jgi:penicillin-binding protein 2